MPLDTTNWSEDNPARGFPGPASFQAAWPRTVDEPGQASPQHSDPATDLLIRARALLKRGWCRRAQAQNRFGFPVSPFSDRAVAWCMDGALRTAAVTASVLDQHRARCRLLDAIGDIPVPRFNDIQETVEPILAAFDRAITMGHVDG